MIGQQIVEHRVRVELDGRLDEALPAQHAPARRRRRRPAPSAASRRSARAARRAAGRPRRSPARRAASVRRSSGISRKLPGWGSACSSPVRAGPANRKRASRCPARSRSLLRAPRDHRPRAGCPRATRSPAPVGLGAPRRAPDVRVAGELLRVARAGPPPRARSPAPRDPARSSVISGLTSMPGISGPNSRATRPAGRGRRAAPRPRPGTGPSPRPRGRRSTPRGAPARSRRRRPACRRTPGTSAATRRRAARPDGVHGRGGHRRRASWSLVSGCAVGRRRPPRAAPPRRPTAPGRTSSRRP